jgi:serine protease Do
VIVSSDGTVLTNNHVVAQAEEILVTTADGTRHAARLVGGDPKSDLAVLRLEGKTGNLAPIELGDVSRLRLGDVVLAIGNPFGVGQTVTMGIVSAKGRANLGIVDYEDFIQTDAAINPGNSGGALVDMEGKLVGINTAILSRHGGYMGIGFAIPIDMATPIMKSLLEHGKVVRGWLGVMIQDVDQDIAEILKLRSTDGVLVSDVQPGSPGARAGLARGDVILSVNRVRVDDPGRLRNEIAAAGAGKTVSIEVLRPGEKRKLVLEVKLDAMPEERSQSLEPATAREQGQERDGITIEPLDQSTRSRFGLPSEIEHGVVITQLVPGSRAAKAGLRQGDVILEVNRQRVLDLASFERLWKATPRRLLLISRDGQTVFVVVG